MPGAERERHTDRHGDFVDQRVSLTTAISFDDPSNPRISSRRPNFQEADGFRLEDLVGKDEELFADLARKLATGEYSDLQLVALGLKALERKESNESQEGPDLAEEITDASELGDIRSFLRYAEVCPAKMEHQKRSIGRIATIVSIMGTLYAAAGPAVIDTVSHIAGIGSATVSEDLDRSNLGGNGEPDLSVYGSAGVRLWQLEGHSMDTAGYYPTDTDYTLNSGSDEHGGTWGGDAHNEVI
jgi:hypothetical protein